MVTLIGAVSESESSASLQSWLSESTVNKFASESDVPSPAPRFQTSSPSPSVNQVDGASSMMMMSTQASKCLHVGNVPPTLSEKDLVAEFAKYGSVETVKLINQRGRRFAFVCYNSIDMAVNAKTLMSRVHPWKSAISFAHREFTNAMTRETHAGGGSNIWNDQAGYVPSRSASTSPFISKTTPAFPSRFSPPPFASEAINSGLYSPHSGDNDTKQGDEWSQGVDAASQAVMRRLCDDTYVPTQAWPVDLVADAPFCEAVTVSHQSLPITESFFVCRPN